MSGCSAQSASAMRVRIAMRAGLRVEKFESVHGPPPQVWVKPFERSKR